MSCVIQRINSLSYYLIYFISSSLDFDAFFIVVEVCNLDASGLSKFTSSYAIAHMILELSII